MNNPFDTWIGPVEIEGHLVATYRKMRSLSVEQLARKACVGEKTIQRWEAAGVTKADIEKIRSIAEALTISPLELLTVDFRQKIERLESQSLKHLLNSERQRKEASNPQSFNRLSQLPDDLSSIVGRAAEVGEIVERLLRDGKQIGISALHGMGGIGKTTLAVHVAHRVKDQFPDAQLFLDLQGVSERPMTAAEVMSRFIRDFHPEAAALPETEAELLPIYRSTLASKRALIILDNVAGEAQVKNLIAGEKTRFIITSRNVLALDDVESVQIELLSPEDSLALLQSIAGTKGTDAELQLVAELCGYLPLALRVAGDFLRLKEAWTVDKYINALKQERLRWLTVGDDPRKNVDFVLKLSSAQLVRENVALALRWHYLADWPTDFSVDAVAAAWECDPNDSAVLEDLSELADRSLVLFDPGTSRFRLHDLMKPIASGLFA